MAAPEQMKMQRAIQQANLQRQQLANQYYGQDMDSQIRERLANVKRQQLLNQYYPQEAKSQIDYRKAQMMAQSPIGQQLSDRNYLVHQYGAKSPQVKMFDQQMNIANQAKSAQANYQTALGNSLGIRYATPQSRQQLVASLQKMGIPVEKALQIAADPEKYFPVNQGNSQMMSPAQQQGLAINPQMAAQGMSANPQIAQALGANYQADPLSQAVNQLTPEERQRALQQGSESQSLINAKTIPVDAQKRLYAANRARVYANSLIEKMPTAMQYFGPQARVKLTKDQLKSVINGESAPELADLANFKSDLEDYKEEASYMLGIPADQQARGEFGQAFDLNKWYTNPKLAQQSLMHIIQKITEAEKFNTQNISDAIKQTDQPLPGIGQAISTQIRAKTANSNIPTFKSKAELRAWLAQASPEEIAAMKQKMRGQ